MSCRGPLGMRRCLRPMRSGSVVTGITNASAGEGTMQAIRVSGRAIYFFGALGGLLFGYDTGVISGALLFIPNDFKLSPFLQGAIVAGLLLGAMIGAAAAGRLADAWGRRRLIMAAAVVFTAGAVLAAEAPSVWVLIAARIII